MFSYHLVHSNLLFDISDLLDLSLSSPTNQVLTRYLDNSNNLNLVINLMFLRHNFAKIDNHTIIPDFCYLLDHAPLTVNVINLNL